MFGCNEQFSRVGIVSAPPMTAPAAGAAGAVTETQRREEHDVVRRYDENNGLHSLP